MPSGLNNVPAVFQVLVNDIVWNMLNHSFVFVYMDDIVIVSKNERDTLCRQSVFTSVRLAKGSNPAHMITKKRSHWFSHSCGYIQAMLHNVRGLFMQGQSVENVFVKKGEKWTQCVSKMFQSLMDQFLFLHRGKWEAIVLGISTASVLREYNI